MSDQPDPLLDALGALERDDDGAHPDAWEDVLRGRSSADTTASNPDASPPDEHAMLAALFTAPLPAQEVNRLVDRFLADQKPASPKVVPLHRRRSTWAGAAAALAAAALVLLWVRTDPSTSGEFVDYSLALRSPSVQDVRASDGAAAAPRYRRDSTIDWWLSPQMAVSGEHALRILARDDGGHAQLLAPTAERSPEGVLRISGRLDALLPLGPGRWRLSFFVTKPAAAPLDPASAAALQPVEQLEIDILP